ncbi:Metallophosphoesterase domain-containing protein [Lachnellula suecica]|uniref:Metallophosphoesterase domain-containing protein n=1 Tax=Lachnellula suecica TaxID=602035 RepID=A0A8T9C4Q6_9HELO|nr:Metallophosphoesterase domain-containing protein [Lachnellula suecica]
MAAPSISTRFLFISDTHDFKPISNSIAFRAPVPKVGVVLHCGDLTQVGGSSEYKRALKMLASIPAELKLVIAGNHDLSLDSNYWRMVLEDEQEGEREDYDEAMEIMTGALAAEAGVTYLSEGIHTFTLQSGARFSLYASPYQPKFGDWASGYGRGEDRFNTAEQAAAGVTSIAENPVPNFPGIDVVITHGPPRGILDESPHGNLGCESLMRALKRCRPRMHCFGHIHEGYGAKVITWEEKDGAEYGIQKEDEKENRYPESSHWPIEFGKQTLMVNAAIMDGKNQPTNDPWVIDLDLQRPLD